MKFGKLFQIIKNFFLPPDKLAIWRKHQIKEEVPTEEEIPTQEITEPEIKLIELNMPLKFYSIMEDLAQTMNCSVSNVLQKSIDLMKFAVDAKLQGKKIGIFNSDGQLETEIVGIIDGDKGDVPKTPIN